MRDLINLIEGSHQTATIEDIMGYPDSDEMIWNFIGDADLEVPFEVRVIHSSVLGNMLEIQYGDIDFDNLDEERREIVDGYKADPELSNYVIILADGVIVDGNHKALAAVENGVNIRYIDIAEDSE